MKNSFLAVLLFLVVSASVAISATVPAGWDSNPYYTFQTWSFNTASVDNVYTPDSGFINANGTATMTPGDGIIWDNGFLTVAGPATSNYLSSPMMAGVIPSAEIPGRTMEIWVNVIFKSNLAPAELSPSTYAIIIEGSNYFGPNQDDIVAGFAAPDVWDFQIPYTLTYQPASATLHFGLHSIADGKYFDVDSIAVATRSVPEPATLAVLALGGIAFIKRRK